MDRAAELSRHLPALEMVVTENGPIFTIRCSCGWDDPTSQKLAATAGREYDRHLGTST